MGEIGIIALLISLVVLTITAFIFEPDRKRAAYIKELNHIENMTQRQQHEICQSAYYLMAHLAQDPCAAENLDDYKNRARQMMNSMEFTLKTGSDKAFKVIEEAGFVDPPLGPRSK